MLVHQQTYIIYVCLLVVYIQPAQHKRIDAAGSRSPINHRPHGQNVRTLRTCAGFYLYRIALNEFGPKTLALP